MASIARLNQHVPALLGSTSGLAVGTSLGWNSLASQALRMAIGWESSEADLVCVALPAAACLGALSLPGLMWMPASLSSSRAIAYVAAPPLAAGWIVVCLADYSYPMLLVGRCLTGLGVGAFTTLVPLYTAEISTVGQRDLNLVYFHVMISLGIVWAYGSTVYVSTLNLDLLPLQLYSVLCMLASLPGLFACYAPSSRLQRLNPDSAEAVREFVAREQAGELGDEAELQREIERTRNMARDLQQPQKRLKLLSSARFWRVFAVVALVTISQHLSGSYLVIFNVHTLIEFTGSGQLTPAWLSLICAKSQTLGSILALPLVSRLGRRVLLTASTALMGLALILLGWFIKERDSYDSEFSKKYGWIPAACIGIYFGSYGLGLGPLSSALLANSFPVELRLMAAASIVGIGWLTSLILNTQLMPMLMNYGLHGTMWLFAAFSILGSVIAVCGVRETKGKSLAFVQEEFRIS